MTEYELLQLVKNGDRSAFRSLVEQYRQKVFTTCLGFLHNKEDAEDIAQEVFVEVFRSVGSFRQDSKLSTWLYRISVNKSLNYIKKNRKHYQVLSIDSIFDAADNETKSNLTKFETDEDSLEKRENAKLLYDAVESLGANQKIAFTLHKYDELSYKEISEIMDLSISSIESLIHRAKLNLQKKLIKFYKS